MSSVTGYSKQKIDSMLAGVPTLWTPNTVYAANSLAVSPNGDVVARISAGTSPATYAADVSNWALSATYALGGGSSRMITGPTLPTLPAGTEYVWNKTDGAGTLLDILTGVA